MPGRKTSNYMNWYVNRFIMDEYFSYIRIDMLNTTYMVEWSFWTIIVCISILFLRIYKI